VNLPDDLPGEMERLPLDLDTADRLLTGSIAPSDAPPGYARVAGVLATLEASAGERPAHEGEIVALLAETVRASRAPRAKTPGRSTVPRMRLASALVAAALVGTTGLALGGNLPGAAQDVAASMLAKLGVSVPGPDSHAGTHSTVRGSAPEQVQEQEQGQGQGQGPASTGAAISELATTTELTGVAKGAAISTLASGGTSGAGENGAAGETHGAPVEAPNEGGTATANAASGGASSIGTSEADTASAGHSAAGAGNAAAGASHRP
jgi:hypothetical protein